MIVVARNLRLIVGTMLFFPGSALVCVALGLHTEKGWLLPLLLGVVGLAVAVSGGTLAGMELWKRQRLKLLIIIGRTVTAEVVGVSRTLRRGRRGCRISRPYRILCEWTDPDNGVRHTFESDKLWRHPGDIATVAVHMDPFDPQIYHVATDYAGVF